MRRFVVVALLPIVVGCSSGGTAQPSPRQAAPYDCQVLLGNADFAGLRLVEASSYGSNEDLCLLASASARTAGATAAAPVAGKRVIVRHADGSVVEVTDIQFKQAPIDPGDAGPVVSPK